MDGDPAASQLPKFAASPLPLRDLGKPTEEIESVEVIEEVGDVEELVDEPAEPEILDDEIIEPETVDDDLVEVEDADDLVEEVEPIDDEIIDEVEVVKPPPKKKK